MTTRERICTVAREWVGTPFFPHGSKRHGADCVGVLLGIYQEAGLVPADVQFPKYDLGGGEHLANSLVIQWLSSCPWVVAKSLPALPGDIVTIRLGRVDHHVMLVLENNELLHSIRRYGCCIADMRDSTYAKRIQTCWAPKDER